MIKQKHCRKVIKIKKCSKEFKEEALRLSDEIGLKKQQLN